MNIKILNKHIPYQGFFAIEVYELQHELFAGGWSAPLRRELLERGRAVAVLLHDPTTDQVLLVEQFRIGAIAEGAGAWQLEIVAGILESGETAEEVARREAIEEAACTIQQLEHMLDYYPSAGGSSELITLYYAAVDLSTVQPGIYGLDNEQEDIRSLLMPLSEAMALVNSGKIRSSMTIIALQWLALRKATATISQASG